MMARIVRGTCLGAALSACALTSPAQAITLGQTDTFEDGSTQGWSIGAGGSGPAAPANVATDGPAGADDNFLKLTSLGGSGSASRLVTFNGGQWVGDYAAAGVTAIQMDLRNLGSTDLSIGLMLGGVVTTHDFKTVLAQSDWQTVTFSLAASDLDANGGSVQATLANVSQLRIFHGIPTGAGSPFPGPAIAAILGVDNITAVPEAGTWVMLATGLGLLGLTAIRRRAAG